MKYDLEKEITIAYYELSEEEKDLFLQDNLSKDLFNEYSHFLFVHANFLDDDKKLDINIKILRDEVEKVFKELFLLAQKECQKDNIDFSEVLYRFELTNQNANDLLLSLYDLAYYTVYNHYNGLRQYNEDMFYMKFLADYLNKRIAKLLYDKAQFLIDDIKPLDDKMKFLLRLNNNGTKITWWDMDGSYRKEFELDAYLSTILDKTPKRDNQLMQDWQSKIVLLSLVINFWEDVFLSNYQDYLDESKINELIDLVNPNHLDTTPRMLKVLEAVFINFEGRLRETSNAKIINYDKYTKIMNDYFSEEFIEAIMEKELAEYYDVLDEDFEITQLS